VKVTQEQAFQSVLSDSMSFCPLACHLQTARLWCVDASVVVVVCNDNGRQECS